MKLNFKTFLEMGMKNISLEDKEIVTIRDGNAIRADDGGDEIEGGKHIFAPIYINIFRDSSQNQLIASCEVFPILGTKYYQLHSNSFVKGYGPLLYDIAIEYVTMKGKSLISSTAAQELFGNNSLGRGGVTSHAAQNVYEKYYNERSDVTKKKINSEKIENEPEYFNRTPWLFVSYSKEPKTINYLKSNKKLFINQEINKSHDFVKSDGFHVATHDPDIHALVDSFIQKTPELQNRDIPPAKMFGKHWFPKDGATNLVYTYIRRFFQIKDRDYVKEKNITKYSWKDLVDIVDYRQNKKLF